MKPNRCRVPTSSNRLISALRGVVHVLHVTLSVLIPRIVANPQKGTVKWRSTGKLPRHRVIQDTRTEMYLIFVQLQHQLKGPSTGWIGSSCIYRSVRPRRCTKHDQVTLLLPHGATFP